MKGILERGIQNKQLFEIIYLNKEGKFTQRVITVVAMTDHHVKANCHLRHQLRVFRLENILAVRLYKKPFRFKGVV